MVHVYIWLLVTFSGGRGSYLDFSVARAGCEQTVIRGEGTAQHLVIMRLDLCKLLTCGAVKHLSTEHGNKYK